MLQVSLFDQLEVMMSMIVSSPLNLLILLFISAIIALLIIDYKKKQKIIERIILISLFILGLIIFFFFFFSILGLLDSFMNNLIRTIYFPNYVVYILILITSNLVLIYSILNNEMGYSYKISNYTLGISLDFIAILLFNVIIKNNINLTEEITINSNKDLLILLQLTTEIFTLWFIIICIIYVIKKLIMIKDKEYRKQQLAGIRNIKFIKPKVYSIDKKNKLIRKEVIDFDDEIVYIDEKKE